MPEFLGLPCVELKNEALSLLVTETVGPRILSLRVRGGENLFAEVPDFTLDCPGAGKCRLWGGHRLWAAPEVPEVTYWPDDGPVKVDTVPGGLRITAQPQPSGLRKSMQVILAPEPTPAEALVFVEHTLTNAGPAPVTCAPWAITQFKTGGTAWLMNLRSPQDPEGLQADRRISLWPYTDVRSPHLEWENESVTVHARMTSGALKVGVQGGGILHYFRDGTLFTKTCHPVPAYRDSSSECYCNDRFLELETLAPVSALGPGESVMHREAWNVRSGVTLEEAQP